MWRFAALLFLCGRDPFHASNETRSVTLCPSDPPFDLVAFDLLLTLVCSGSYSPIGGPRNAGAWLDRLPADPRI